MSATKPRQRAKAPAAIPLQLLAIASFIDGFSGVPCLHGELQQATADAEEVLRRSLSGKDSPNAIDVVMDEVKGSDQELLEGIERGIWLGVVLAYRCMGGVR